MTFLNWTIIALNIVLSLATAGHALLFKRTPSSALAWVAVCLMFPFFGPFFYFLFGINRVQTRARRLEDKRPVIRYRTGGHPDVERMQIQPEKMDFHGAITGIAKIADAVTHLPLVSGNGIDLLHNGDTAYPAMLESIAKARERIFLATYIFDTDTTGRRFIDALAEASRRGVEVRVIVDGFGELYSLPWASSLLKRKGVHVVRFLPPKIFPPMVNINLRTHRKLLIVDGETGYTGGMNIGDRHLVEQHRRKSGVVDTHFKLTGPIVRQLENTFIDDWMFCTGETMEPTQTPPVAGGDAVCRAIVDGPNEDVNKLSTILVGAISTARKRVQIMTPYFLPSVEMISALQTTSLRGIEVEIVLPSVNNLPFVQWASNNMLADLLCWGVRIYCQPPPFVHSKLFVVDDEYAQIGSANIDPRSLRLNFELSVEIYDRVFTEQLSAYINDKIRRSNPIHLREINSRPVIIKARDALTWLFSPYL